MSVLVEATTVIVRRQHLDSSYPGGASGFLAGVSSVVAPRFVCDGDPLLVSVSVSDRREARAVIEMLGHLAPEVSPGTGDPEYACVDQEAGPTHPCTWLVWERFAPGVTIAWMAGREPGALAAPEGWRPPTEDERAAKGLLRLSTDNGVRISLDLSTGREVVTEDAGTEVTPPATPLHDELLRALAGTGWCLYHTDAPTAMVDLRGTAALYSCRYFVAEELRTIACTTRAPVLIPESARDRAMQFITRANFGLFYGSFELDLDDGTMLFRANCAVLDGAITTEMVGHMASSGAWMFDRYLPRLLQVVFGRRRVRGAVDEADQA